MKVAVAILSMILAGNAYGFAGFNRVVKDLDHFDYYTQPVGENIIEAGYLEVSLRVTKVFRYYKGRMIIMWKCKLESEETIKYFQNTFPIDEAQTTYYHERLIDPGSECPFEDEYYQIIEDFNDRKIPEPSVFALLLPTFFLFGKRKR